MGYRKRKWLPELYDQYFTVAWGTPHGGFHVLCRRWHNRPDDVKAFESGLVFKLNDDAQKVVDKLAEATNPILEELAVK